MKCKHCGEEIPQDSIFCEFCGTKVKGQRYRLLMILGAFFVIMAVCMGLVLFFTQQDRNSGAEKDSVVETDSNLRDEQFPAMEPECTDTIHDTINVLPSTFLPEKKEEKRSSNDASGKNSIADLATDLENIHITFRKGDDTPLIQNKSLVSSLVEKVKKNPQFCIVAEFYVLEKEFGTEEKRYIHYLSRMENVRNYFEKEGVDPDQLEVHSYSGEDANYDRGVVILRLKIKS